MANVETNLLHANCPWEVRKGTGADVDKGGIDGCPRLVRDHMKSEPI